MPADRNRIAAVLERIGDLLVIREERPFRGRAFRRAARAMERFEGDLAVAVAEGRIRNLPGIGPATERAIREIYASGGSKLLEEIRAGLPDGLEELLRVPGLGPARVRTLLRDLGIASLEALEEACRDGRLEEGSGFGEKARERILEGVLQVREYRGKVLLADGDRRARTLIERLLALPTVQRVEGTGALRRRELILREIDLLVGVRGGQRDRSLPSQSIRNLAREFPGLSEVVEGPDGEIRATFPEGVAARIFPVPNERFPLELLRRTGPDSHWDWLVRRATQACLALGPGGVEKDGREVLPGSEEEVYRLLGLPFLPPELRSDARALIEEGGEELPWLVRREDLRGVLHVHTTWSDGAYSIEEMAAEAGRLGFEYVGISDHSPSARVANGLSPERLLRQMEEIDRWNGAGRRPRILRGSEVDILEDGRLDWEEGILARLDFVIGSIHSGFRRDREAMTRRIVRAMENPRLTIVGHPTGRLMLTREGYPVDLREVVRQAARRGVAVELNANPRRLDLEPDVARLAAELGVAVSINPDAHTTEALADVEYGVTQARRALLRPEHVLNCLPVDAFVGCRPGRHREMS